MSVVHKTSSVPAASDGRLLVALAMPDRGRLTQWQSHCVQALAASNEIRLVAWIAGGNATSPAKVANPGLPYWRQNDERIATDCDIVLALQAGYKLSLFPRLGRWELRLGGLDPETNELLGCREAVAGLWSITLEWIAVQDAAGHSRLLNRAVLRTRWTPWQTRNSLLRAAPALLMGAILRVWGGHCSTHRMPAQPVLSFRPTVPRVALAWLRQFIRRAEARWLQAEIWTIGILPISVSALLAGEELPPPAWLDPPRRGQFHADPFPLHVQERTYLLFETWSDRKARGWITVARLDETGRMSELIPSIVFDHHTSYPSIFEYGGSIWCAPEISAAGGLRLLRMEGVPWEWSEIRSDFPDTALIDPTLFRHGDRWWLFAGLYDAQEELHAWYSASPLGPWKPHALNPIKTDIGSARPAGAVFRVGDDIYRPGQDCAQTYGKAVILHRILRLDPDDFEEVVVRRIEPSQDWPWKHGLHTFNLLDQQIVIDAKRHMIRPVFLVHALRL